MFIKIQKYFILLGSYYEKSYLIITIINKYIKYFIIINKNLHRNCQASALYYYLSITTTYLTADIFKNRYLFDIFIKYNIYNLK